jgi:uncharacterized protein (DUF427 family)
MTLSEHVRLAPVKRVVVRLGGQSIVDSARGVVVFEGVLPPRYYVPRDDVHGELSDGTGAATCPWKGKWKHLDLKAGEQRVANAGWTYFEPTPVCESIREFVAFYPDKVESLDVE